MVETLEPIERIVEPVAIGTRVPRVDAREKSTGAARYTMDVQLPGMLVARILRSPVPHARIARIDTSKAERLPGVHAVLTYKNVPHVKYNCARHSPQEMAVEDEAILEDKVRLVGDKVAAVAAETEAIAEQALRLIEVEYEELPAVYDPVEAMQPDAPIIHEHLPNNIADEVHWKAGEVEAGMAAADYIFEKVCRVPRQQHAPIEPHCCVAQVDGSGRVTIWSSTQVPFICRWLVGRILNIPITRIRVYQVYVGGAFGGKDDIFEEPLAVVLAQRAGRPVKLVYDRREEFIAARVRHAMHLELKVGVKRDGTITAMQLRAILENGAFTACTGGVMRVLGVKLSGLYHVSNLQYDGYAVYTNTPISAAFRGYANPQHAFVTETLIDEIAERLGIDPIEMRLKNVIQVGEKPAWGLPIASNGIAECIQRAAERIGWSEWRRQKAAGQGQPGGRFRRGMGMAIASHTTSGTPGLPEVSAAIVKMNEDGTATVLTGAAELGQGSDTTMAQIAADALGVPLKDVQLVSGDTDRVPFDFGAYASRTTHVAGNAVALAALDARKKLATQASKMLEADPEDLEFREGRVWVRGAPDRAVTVKQVVEYAYFGAGNSAITGEASYHPISNVPAFAAQFVEVEVDTETGQVRVLRVVAGHDVGRAINPMAIEGQVEGAVAQAIGYALTEDLVIDPKSGQPLNPNFTDYRVPLAPDMPSVDTIIVQTVEPNSPLGAKSVGEIGLVATPAAIANAIYDALGVRLNQLPMTAERVLAAMGT